MSQRRKVLVSSSEESSTESSSEDEYQPASSRKNSVQKVKKRNKNSSRMGASIFDDAASGSSEVLSSGPELSAEEATRCAGLVANYFIAAECRKIPVKKSDLVKVIGKQFSRKLSPIIEEANNMLLKVYGYKILELQHHKNTFILFNTLSAKVNDATNGSVLNRDVSEDGDDEGIREPRQLTEVSDERQGLLFIALAVIFMMGGVVEEVTLMSFLKTLGVHVDSKDQHFVLGNCKKLLEEFVRQGYLEVEAMRDVEPPSKQFSWGERSHLQVCKKAILQFVCKVYGGGMQPESWVDHWAQVVGAPATSNGSSSSVEEITDVEATQPRTQ